MNTKEQEKVENADGVSRQVEQIVMPTHCGLKIGDEVEVETTGAIGTVDALLPDGEVCVDLGLYSRVYHCTILNYPE